MERNAATTLAVIIISATLFAGGCESTCPRTGDTSATCAEQRLPGLRIPTIDDWRIAQVTIRRSNPGVVVQAWYGPSDGSRGLLVLLTSYPTANVLPTESLTGRATVVAGIEVQLDEDPEGHAYIATLGKQGLYYQLEILFEDTPPDRVAEIRAQFVAAIAEG